MQAGNGHAPSSSRQGSAAFVLVSSGIFECPLETDGTLSISNVQSQIPYANGLNYVAEEGSQYRRAIRFDRRTGKFYSPEDGWGRRVYTVASFVGDSSTSGTPMCLMRNSPVAFDRYDRATRTFRESVDAVERLFDISSEPAAANVARQSTPSALGKTMEKQKQEIAKLRAQNRELESEKQHLEMQLDEKESKLSSMTAEMQLAEDVVNGIVSLREARVVGESQLQPSIPEELLINDNSQSDELEKVKEKNLNLEQELEETRKMYHDTKWRNGELEATIAWKNGELEKTVEESRGKDEALLSANRTIEGLQNRCNQLEVNINEIEKRAVTEQETGAQWQIYELQANVNSLETQNRELTEEGLALKQRLLELEEQLQLATESAPEAVESQNEEEQLFVTTMPPIQAMPAFVEKVEEVERLKEELHAANKRWNEMQDDLEKLRVTEKELHESLMCTRRELEDAKWRCGELENLLVGGAFTQSQTPMADAKQRIGELLREVDRLRRLNDEALWRLSEMQSEMGTEEQHLNESERKRQDLDSELEEKRTKLNAAEARVKELETAMLEIQSKYGRATADQDNSGKRAVEAVSRLGDTNWEVEKQSGKEAAGGGDRLKWMEDQLAHYKHLYGDTQNKLNDLMLVLDSAHRHLWDAFVIRKEPFVDREKWKLSTWYEGSQEQFARVWFELDAPDAEHVYMALSRYNWECLLLMMWHENGKWGLWVDLIPGRHEFKFLVDGQWKITDQFPTCPGGFENQLNNWRQVE